MDTQLLISPQLAGNFPTGRVFLTLKVAFLGDFLRGFLVVVPLRAKIERPTNPITTPYNPQNKFFGILSFWVAIRVPSTPCVGQAVVLVPYWYPAQGTL